MTGPGPDSAATFSAQDRGHGINVAGQTALRRAGVDVDRLDDPDPIPCGPIANGGGLVFRVDHLPLVEE